MRLATPAFAAFRGSPGRGWMTITFNHSISTDRRPTPPSARFKRQPGRCPDVGLFTGPDMGLPPAARASRGVDE
jgi:hypothetical protein